MTQEGEKNVDFLEVIFMVLSFGYEGKYYKQDRMVKDEICHHLFKIIETYRKRQVKKLLPTQSLVGKEEKKYRLDSKTRLIVLLTLSATVILWFSFNVLTYRDAKITLTELHQLGNEGASADFQQSPQGQAKWAGDFYDTNN